MTPIRKIKTGFKFINKILDNKESEHIVNQLKFPNRSTSRVYDESGVKSVRGAGHLCTHTCIELYNAMPPNSKS